MFGFLNSNEARIRDLTQLLGNSITRVDSLEAQVSSLRKQLIEEKQMRINNEKAVLEQGRILYELREAMQGLCLEHGALYSFVDLLTTTGIKLKLDYDPVDDEKNPDGEIDNGSEKAS